MKEFPDWRRRDNFSVDAHQRVIDGLRQLFGVPGAGVGDEHRPPDEPRIAQACIVTVDSAAPDGGVYIGQILKPTITDLRPDTGSPTTLFTFGQYNVEQGWSAIVLNAAEAGRNTHDLISGAPNVENHNNIHVGYVRSRNSNNAATAGPYVGYWVVVINAFDWEDCS